MPWIAGNLFSTPEEAMKMDWLGRVRGAVLVGLAWAVAWALVAVLAGLIVDPDGSMDEMWVAIGAYPGFLCGVLCSAALGIAGARRRMEGVSLSGAGVRGAAVGLLVGVLPFIVGEPTSEIPLWQLGAGVVGSIALLSAVSAAVTVLVFRRAAWGRAPVTAGPKV
ncbi:MAG TPA: hypothetical protein VF615_19470 [Longimicrobiaceae bacterium]